MKRALVLISVLAGGATVAAAQSEVIREEVPGIRNLARIETTVACAGAITPESVTGIKEMGFVSIINLREASEPGADIDAEAAAARAAGVNYVHVPFNGSSPETSAVDRFVEAISEPANEPAFIHCSGGNRAASMWFVKRALVDEWEVDRAMAEAAELGFRSESLKAFMTEYVETHRR